MLQSQSSVTMAIKLFVFFLVGDSQVPEFYAPTFRNTVSSIFIGECFETSAHKIQTPRIAQKKEHNAQNMAKV
jgi:hypothetical protein